MPRSLRYSHDHVRRALTGLSDITGGGEASLTLARDYSASLRTLDIPAILRRGLHEFLTESLRVTVAIADTAAADYHFN
jgi:uncharacterized alpha-E superfamily protein